jgi:hypothetical protein
VCAERAWESSRSRRSVRDDVGDAKHR